MIEWICVSEELPPENGNYYVTNFPNDAWDEGVAYYDGWGFMYLGCYRTPKYWRKCRTIPKKYGKQK
jgi:hypothetical protein